MNKLAHPLLMALLLAIPIASSASQPFVGKPKTRSDLARCEIVQSTYSKKVYTRPKDEKIIKTMAPKWALCKAKEVPKTVVFAPATTVQKTPAQLQLDLEALNMTLHGNPFGPSMQKVAPVTIPAPLPPQVAASAPVISTPVVPSAASTPKPSILSFTAEKKDGLSTADFAVLKWESQNTTACVIKEGALMTQISQLTYEDSLLPSGSKSLSLENKAGNQTWTLFCVNDKNEGDRHGLTILGIKEAPTPLKVNYSFQGVKDSYDALIEFGKTEIPSGNPGLTSMTYILPGVTKENPLSISGFDYEMSYNPTSEARMTVKVDNGFNPITHSYIPGTKELYNGSYATNGHVELASPALIYQGGITALQLSFKDSTTTWPYAGWAWHMKVVKIYVTPGSAHADEKIEIGR